LGRICCVERSLIVVLELTGNPHVILPGMLAILSATLATRHIFQCESIFIVQLQEIGVLQRT
jgi:CIC family chloride channel protein